MFRGYYRLKKYRKLKNRKFQDVINRCIEDENAEINCVQQNLQELPAQSRDNENVVMSQDEFSNLSSYHENRSELVDTFASSIDSFLEAQSPSTDPDFKEKIVQWTLKNLSTLRLNVVSELLIILRGEGYSCFPKTCQTLLGTRHHRKLNTMVSQHDTNGEYIYLGIEKGLQNIISIGSYDENYLNVLVFIDGMQVFRNANTQAWPIVVKVLNTRYTNNAFIAGIYMGDSKPQSAEDFLFDFVKEVNELTINGVLIDKKNFIFRVTAIIADAQARAYLKCCKSPGTFYACERCTIKGITVGQNRKKKRVYPDMDCEARTKNSFISKSQPQHHKENSKCLLECIIDFDPVNYVVLDSMHLLYLGIMKYLMKSWIERKSLARLRLSKVKELRESLLSMKCDIPGEFQRKNFDIRNLASWKATQFRFILLYCGAIVFKGILTENYYKHFLLLVVACRILHNTAQILDNTSYAKELLRKFFFLLPTLYGEQSQTLNHHNLIHLADDVENLKVDLSTISAFWGENYIGIFKKYVKSPNKPLTQIVNRLSEIESKIPKISKIENVIHCVFNHDPTRFLYADKHYHVISELTLSNCTLKSNSPDNIVELENGLIYMIKVILLKGTRNLANYTPEKGCIFFGVQALNTEYVFEYPTSSSDVGVICATEFSEELDIIPVKRIRNKSVLLNIMENQYVISLLHF